MKFAKVNMHEHLLCFLKYVRFIAFPKINLCVNLRGDNFMHEINPIYGIVFCTCSVYILFLYLASSTSNTLTQKTCRGNWLSCNCINNKCNWPPFFIGPASNGVVRLYRNGVTSSSYHYGIVQIWYNGEWGNICDDDDYDQYEADVICHQLGYTGASSYSRAGSVRLVIYILYN